MSTALIIVDLQYDFLEEGALAVPRSNMIIPEICTHMNMERYSFVIVTMDWHPKQHISFASRHGKDIGTSLSLDNGISQIMWPDHCVQHTKGAELHKAIAQRKIDCYIKKGTDINIDSYSAFFDNCHLKRTELDEVLRAQGIEELYICGLATDYCVYFTVLDALDSGYKVNVLKDACQAVNLREDDGKKALQAMKDKGASIL